MKGKAFLVKSKDELEIFKELPNSDMVERVFFQDNTLFSAIEDGGVIAVIARNHRNCIFDKETFNKHFEIKL